MPQGHDLSLKGRVVAVAADGGHHFSKPARDQIVLVEGHGPTPAPSFGTDISPGASPGFPTSGRST